MSLLKAKFFVDHGDFQLDVAFEIPGSGVSALFGPSGCGKTSVLRCLAGLTPVKDGTLVINGTPWHDKSTNLATHQRAVGYVFQEANLFAHLSVADNLRFGQKRSKTAKNALAFEDVVQLLGLGKLLDRSPKRLSGGERQRVAIGRALLSGPEILLMDEPLAALDRFNKNEIIPYLEKLHQTLSIPIVYVSHDIAEVERLADHMILMDNGKIKAQGPLDVLLSDPTLPFAREPEAASVLLGEIRGYDEDFGLNHFETAGTTLLVPGPRHPVGRAQRLRILASDVALSNRAMDGQTSILNSVQATVQRLEPLGDHRMQVYLSLGKAPATVTLLARITRKSAQNLELDTGKPVYAMIKSMAMVDRL